MKSNRLWGGLSSVRLITLPPLLSNSLSHSVHIWKYISMRIRGMCPGGCEFTDTSHKHSTRSADVFAAHVLLCLLIVFPDGCETISNVCMFIFHSFVVLRGIWEFSIWEICILEPKQFAFCGRKPMKNHLAINMLVIISINTKYTIM